MYRLPETEFADLESCAEEVRLKHLLWDSVCSWAITAEQFSTMPFMSLDTAAFEATVAQYVRTIQKIERGLAPDRVGKKSKARHAPSTVLLPAAAPGSKKALLADVM